MKCVLCESEATRRDGKTRLGGQRWRCDECCRRFTGRSTSVFSHQSFPDDLMVLAVRWYVRYRLSYAGVVECLAERGAEVNHSTVYRWVRRFLPLFCQAVRSHRRPAGGKWHVDETYCRLNSKWVIGETGARPTRITIDKAGCHPPALRDLLPETEQECSKYLNNGLERDHGHLKQRLRSMRGFECPVYADIVTRRHALIQNICKDLSASTIDVTHTIHLTVAWRQPTRMI